MEVTALAGSLRREARRGDERRLLVLSGDRTAGHTAACEMLSGIETDPDAVTMVTDCEQLGPASGGWEILDPQEAAELLGTTREVVVFDAHAGFSPNRLGRVVGAVDGGGLLVVLTPPLSAWPDHRSDFEETMAVPPFGVEDVTGRFRERLVGTLRLLPGVAIVDIDEGTVERDGLTEPEPLRTGNSVSALMGDSRPPPTGDAESASMGDSGPGPPPNASFPEATYEACLTADQGRAVRALEALREPGTAIVVEADRGRGKSSAAGLAAATLVVDGDDVLVTAPSFRATRACFERATRVLDVLGERTTSAAETPADGDSTAAGGADPIPRTLATAGGGRVRFLEVEEAVELSDDPDVVIVDEAAALPVRRLERFLAAPAVAFCTTVHGYEGAGRGFDIRFRERLAESEHEVQEIELSEPIRYAVGDPLEAWSFRALLLDASPAVTPAIEDATLDSVEYAAPSPEDLLEDDHLLREAFGLLVVAHYRTEPNDLGRVLDAPNLRLRLLTHEGHVVSVALLAREGGLDAERRASMYDGSRVRGNMIPDLLTSQLRDEDAAAPVGYRVVRIATHHALRGIGLGSGLLRGIETEASRDDRTTPRADETSQESGAALNSDRGAEPRYSIEPSVGPEKRLDAVDWLGVGYGATPELVRFWGRNGYRTVHFSTTRNDRSGEYSAIMLRPLTGAGAALRERHGRRLRDRVAGLLSDPVRDAEEDVVRALLRTIPAPPDLELTPYEQRVAAGAAYGSGLADVAPGVFRDLALAAFLVEPPTEVTGSGDRPLSTIEPRERRLLVRKCLQAHRWSAVADELGYVSTRECLQMFGETIQPLVDAFCGEPARAVRERYTE
jgi:tRNA(Met) cytidine acetyltransferase